MKALRSFVRSYLLPVSAATVARTTGKYIDILKTDPNPAARRGAALSFSALPAQLLAPMWKGVLDALSAATIAEVRKHFFVWHVVCIYVSYAESQSSYFAMLEISSVIWIPYLISLEGQKHK